MNFEFIKTKNKRLRIFLINDKNLLVSLPTGISREKAYDFIRSKGPWIEKQRKMYIDDLKFTKEIIKNSQFSDPGEFKDFLIMRTDSLGKLHDFKYKRITIRNQKSRWGSCSRKNNINLNINLGFLPGSIQDYVILHELMHTKIKSHSKKFWVELGKICPDMIESRTSLKRINLSYLKDQI